MGTGARPQTDGPIICRRFRADDVDIIFLQKFRPGTRLLRHRDDDLHFGFRPDRYHVDTKPVITTKT